MDNTDRNKVVLARPRAMLREAMQEAEDRTEPLGHWPDVVLVDYRALQEVLQWHDVMDSRATDPSR